MNILTTVRKLDLSEGNVSRLPTYEIMFSGNLYPILKKYTKEAILRADRKASWNYRTYSNIIGG